MYKNNIESLKLNGKEVAQGGHYKTVNISEYAKIEGDLDCEAVIFMGNSAESGVQGNVKTSFAKVQGAADIKGSFTSELLKTWGALFVKGDCEAEVCTLKGGLDIEGMLNAENINIQMFWPSKVKEVGGGQIKIKRLPKLLNEFKNMVNYFKSDELPILTAETIEGDDIHVEYTNADLVRGDHVTIGPGCQIKRVEYRESFYQDPSARIESQQKI